MTDRSGRQTDSRRRKTAFFENARLLSERLGIVPLLYGSLGLEYLTNENLNADDVDILIPRIFIAERWNDLRAVLEESGYVLIDEHEHEFEKDGICYAYAEIEELESFAEIAVPDIEVRRAEGICFRLLNLKQYLKVYSASIRDGYRINVREKKDAEKIEFIKSRMRNECK